MTIGKLEKLMDCRGAIGCLAILFCGLMITVGCKPASDSTTGGVTAAESKVDHEGHDHDGHDHDAEEPKSYAEAYESLVKNQGMIKEAFEGDKRDYAHDPLHDVGGLLNAIKDFAEEDAGLSDDDKAAVATAYGDLMDAFTKLDEHFHGGAEVSYSDVSEQIETGLATLKGFAK